MNAKQDDRKTLGKLYQLIISWGKNQRQSVGETGIEVAAVEKTTTNVRTANEVRHDYYKP